MIRLLTAALLLGIAPITTRSPAEIVAAAPAADFRPVAPENLLLLDLADGGTVAIELAPQFAPAHVASIRALARGGWFDNNAVTRVQDDYVAQWGGADEKRPRPPGAPRTLPAEYERPLAGLALIPLAGRDAYAPRAGFADGWPVASDGRDAWLAHCYGAVGVGRDMPPDTGDGTELYAVIGQAPRQLDRNIALVGRVIDGMERLSSLPRGTAEMGFYADPSQHRAITRVRVAADLPPAGQPRFAVMRTGSRSFAAYLAARTDRRDPFYIRPAGGVDLCNVPVPVRRLG